MIQQNVPSEQNFQHINVSQVILTTLRLQCLLIFLSFRRLNWTLLFYEKFSENILFCNVIHFLPNFGHKDFLLCVNNGILTFDDCYIICPFYCFTVDDPFLVVVRDSIIYGISLNPDEKSNDAMVPIAGLQNGYDVDFDDAEQMIYWVEHPVSLRENKFL